MEEFKVEEFLKEGRILRMRDWYQLKKEELLKIAEHLKVQCPPGIKKVDLIEALITKLSPVALSETHPNAMELQLAKLELEKERIRQKAVQEAATLELDRERMRREFEYKHKELENEQQKLALEKRKIVAMEAERSFDLSKNIRLVPQFCETEVDVFFLSFEKIAKALKWPEDKWSLLVQSVFTGRALEVYAALDAEQSSSYEDVKTTVLAAYQLSPEVYRQRFRNLEKSTTHTYIEYAREKEIAFDRWVRSKNIGQDYEKLKQLILLEDFKSSVSFEVKNYLEDHKVDKIQKAAVMADDFELTHQTSMRGGSKSTRHQTQYGNGAEGGFQRPSRGFKTSQMNVQRPGGMHLEAVVCYYCGKKGHKKTECWALANKPKMKEDTPKPGLLVLEKSKHVGECSNSALLDLYKPFLSSGVVSVAGNDYPVVILRDTGAAQSLWVVKDTTLPPSSLTEMCALIQGVNNDVSEFKSVPLYEVHLQSSLVTGVVKVGVVSSLPIPSVTFVLGNDLAGKIVHVAPLVVNSPVCSSETEALQREFPGVFPTCVVTRSQSQVNQEEPIETVRNPEEPDVILAETFFAEGSADEQKYGKGDLIREQSNDPFMRDLLSQAGALEDVAGEPVSLYVKDGVLMRKWRDPQCPAAEEWRVYHQIVLPFCYREEIMRLAHEVPTSGHLGIKKTKARIMKHFYWPTIRKDVVEFCKTCHSCQMGGKPNQNIPPAPLIPIPVVGEPFSRVLIDCVGPLPKTKRGHQYLLTVMDVATRYVEAFALRNICSKTILDCLLKFFTQFGLPREIQSDQGSNFMAGVFQAVMKELGIKHFKSSVYHPQSQGALERYHQTLKSMIRTYCVDQLGEWDKSVPFLLFAIRDSVCESTGFSPFELVYGHEVRGPLKLVKEKFLAEEPDRNVLDYVCEFKERLKAACTLAKGQLQQTQRKMKNHFDQKAVFRTFAVGDKVLVLLPIRGDPLQAKFSGPYIIKEKVGEVNYVVSTPDRRKSTRLCHVNLIKPYYERNAPSSAAVCVVHHVQEEERDSVELDCLGPKDLKLANSAVLADPEKFLSHLTAQQQNDVTALLKKFSTLFGDSPGLTSLTEHDIDVGVSPPVKQHPYRVNPDKMDKIREEVKYMLQHDIIEPSMSEWSSPVVVVPKPDGSIRLCVDYRKVNTLTKSDSFPIPRIEDCIDRIGTAKFVSKFDLLKGYWQVPLSERAKEISAFCTTDGLYQFKVLPFGVKNAPASFQRLMTRVTEGLLNCTVYIDDVVLYADTWEQHMEEMRRFFERLKEAGLVINLPKSEIGKASITYLGHVVGRGEVRPRAAKVQAIAQMPAPKNKKELMRFLGMAGFYRKFVPNFATVASPLTDLLRKSEKFVWTDSCTMAFEQLKAILSCEPILTAPSFSLPFKLVIDACDVGVGAVLLQEDNLGVDRPVAYFSKKLNPHQRRYSTIEKEALALVLAIQHFEIYVSSGAHFVKVYTDHNPLTFLEKFKMKNQRIFRWGLILQPYNLVIEHIAGKDNVIADVLSRI